MSKILVIDDSKTVRTMCEWIYKGLEDTLITASSASEADGIISIGRKRVEVLDLPALMAMRQ